MYKRIISIALTCLMVLPLTVSTSSAAPTSGKCGDNATWSYNQSTATLTISGTGPMWEYPMEAYLSTAPWAEPYYEQTQKIIVGDGITHIGDWAFSLFCKVKEVSLPSSLVSIGESAFWANDSLLEIWIPSSVISIGSDNFGYAYYTEAGEAPLNGFTIHGYSGTEAERYYKQILSDYSGWKDYIEQAENKWMKNAYADNFGPDGTVYFVDLGKDAAIFTDVSTSAWYAENVAFVVEKGLMVGVGNKEFDPKGAVTVAQAITMAARIHSQFTTGKEGFEQAGGSAWYQPYVDYAKKNKIINDQYDKLLTKKATRAQFADIFSKALPDKGLKKINTVPDRSILDVSMKDSYASGVYKLYRAGILSGSDSKGTFAPVSSITRAEAAAIVARMADEGQRVKVALTAPKAATGHRYEFVISDASWTQAQRTAKAAGGYLARIETREEYMDLIQQLNAAGMQKVELRIGAQRKTGTNDFYWVNANGSSTGPILNSEAFWGYDEWLAGEPSLNWGGNLETVVEIYYDAKLNKWVWNDIWDTVTTPNVGSHFGYIIEYDR